MIHELFLFFVLDTKPRSLSVTSLGTYELLKPKVVILSPPNKINKIGDEVRFVCLLTGYPCSELSWYLNGDIIKPTKDGRIYFGNNLRELVIKSLKAEDNGNLLVHAENKYGEMYTSSNLKIEKIKKMKINWEKSFRGKSVRRNLAKLLSFKWRRCNHK